MKLLHIDAGITGAGSVSRQLSAAVVDALTQAKPALQVVRRDLDADPIPHLDSLSLGQPGQPEVLDQFLDAEIIVIGAPMYNFSIPSQLKAWVDRIVVANKTFRYTADGVEGLAGGRKVVIASARGGVYAPNTPMAELDFHEPYLRAVFSFIGIQDVTILRAEGVNLSAEHRAAALEQALGLAPALVAEMALAA